MVPSSSLSEARPTCLPSGACSKIESNKSFCSTWSSIFILCDFRADARCSSRSDSAPDYAHLTEPSARGWPPWLGILSCPLHRDKSSMLIIGAKPDSVLLATINIVSLSTACLWTIITVVALLSIITDSPGPTSSGTTLRSASSSAPIMPS